MGTGCSFSVAMMIELEELTHVVYNWVSCGLKTTIKIFFQFIRMEILITLSKKLMFITCKLRKSWLGHLHHPISRTATSSRKSSKYCKNQLSLNTLVFL